jgi:RimJ/RimL family protein N-acetyltransferase
LNIKVRPVNLNDEILILRWANDALVRKNAFKSKTISYSSHHSWYLSRINSNADCRIFIAEDEDGAALGQVRFERKGSIWEIDYSIDRVFRGRKLATLILSLALQKIRQEYPNTSFVGKVKKENIPSSKVFEKLGFVAEVKKNFLIWRAE